MNSKRRLPNVTLLTATSVDIDDALEALKISSCEIAFASIKLLASAKPAQLPRIDAVFGFHGKLLLRDALRHLPAQAFAEYRAPAPPRPAPIAQLRAGRNELCPCGSGRKFKRCHGA